NLSFNPGGGVSGGITNAGGQLDIDLGGFVQVSGTATYHSYGVVGVQLDDGVTQLTDVQLSTIAVSAGSLFIGAEGGTPNRIGLSGTIQQLILAFFTKGSDAWTAATGAFDAGIVGIDALDLTATGVTFKYNGKNAAGHAIDLTKVDLGNSTA